MKQKFSERVGESKPRSVSQTGSMDEELRTSLWNVTVGLFETCTWTNVWIRVARLLARDFFKDPVDDLFHQDHDCKNYVKSRFFNLEWYRAYDLIELVAEHTDELLTGGHNERTRKETMAKFNAVLEREMAGYRFINGVLSSISNEAEVAEIEEAISRTRFCALPGASKHLESALRLLGKRPEPDYRNAIKEAISAVEATAKRISGTESGGLDPALKKLTERVDLHRALRTGFNNLYGYTSDEDGIRHSILQEKDIGLPEAKFMMVSCSAFVNFLIAKADQGGLLPSSK